jgi:hypothetical protein
MSLDLRYPIGPFQDSGVRTPERRAELFRELANQPADFRKAVAGLGDAGLETPYRDGGWTLRQVIHHVADSHMHSYLRMKFALTEDKPLIKPYDEQAWSEFEDARGPVEPSLALLQSLHLRWVHFLRSLAAPDFEKAYVHPVLGDVSLAKAMELYAWHGRHHITHITAARERLKF